MGFIFLFLTYVLNVLVYFFFVLMIRRPPRSTLERSLAASDVYKRQTIFTHPYRQRASPKSCPRNISVWCSFKDIDKSLFDSVRDEMNVLCSRNGLCFELIFFDKPRLDSFVDKWRPCTLSLIHLSEPTRPS